MIVTIETAHLHLQKSEKRWMQRYIKTLFARASGVIDTVNVFLSDANGPKGGVDQLCTVVINGKVAAPIVVKDKQTSALQALKSALRRANHVLVRKWKREKLAVKQRRCQADNYYLPTMDDDDNAAYEDAHMSEDNRRD